MAPVYIIDRPKNGIFSHDTLSNLHAFAKKNYGDIHPQGLGSWHLKGSFSTSSRAVKRSKLAFMIPSYTRQIFNKYGHWSIPQVICQRTFANSVVSKNIVSFNIFDGCLHIKFYPRNLK